MNSIRNLFNGGASVESKLQQLKRKTRALQARAEDIHNEIEQEELRPGKRRKKEVDNWLQDVDEAVIQLQRLELRGQDLNTSGWGSSQYGTSICTNQTAYLTEQIGDLLKQGSFPQGFTFYDHGGSSVALVTTDVKIHDEILTDNKKKAISWLIENETISNIGVYGPGGVGKTMLLKEIHNELLERFKSPRSVYWVSVSHGTTLPMLQDKIAEAMDLSYLLTEKNPIRKAASLSYELKQRKNVFLFLDDVWEYLSFEEVGIPVEQQSRCKLILTTRSLDVCRRMKCQELVKVEPLSKEKAWELFAKVLGRRDGIPSEIDELAELVAAECAGLPLGLIVMAGSMRGVEDIQEWCNTLEELRDSTAGQAVIETDIFPVLKLSYDRLKDPKLRQCFLLCALYPKYGGIKREDLIVLFRSEGLLDNIEGWKRQYDKGHSMLNKLENACLLEKYDSKSVKMHNFIRDMAIRITNVMPRFMIAAGAELRRIPSGRRWTIDLDKVSLMHNSLSEIQPGTIPMCPCLTTLLLQKNPFTKLPDSFFTHFKALKVLNLSETSIKRLPNSISELKNLRALLLEFCRRLHFVPSLMKLTKLRELNFNCCWSLKDVPHGIEQLADLRSLDLDGCKDLCRVITGSLSTLTHIQCLQLDPDVQSISGDDIVKLRYLERLEGCRISEVGSFNRYVKTQHFQQLNHYEFVIGAGEYKHLDYIKSDEEQRVVILCSRNPKHSGNEGDLFIPPENTQNLQIHNSELDARSLFDALPSLVHLAALKRIVVRRCRVIEFIWSPQSLSEAAQEAAHEAAVLRLRCLQELILTDLHDFRGLVKEGVPYQQGTFSNLKILVIKYCPKIKKLLNGDLNNLQELEVERCEELEEIAASHDDSFDQDNPTCWLPNLRVLQLRRLPKLRRICHTGLLGKGSLERIIVEYCPEIKEILIDNNLQQHHLRNFREAKIAGCRNLQQIIASPKAKDQHRGVYELPDLRAIDLDDLPCLTSFLQGNVPTCDSIEKITVRDCPNLKRLPLFIPLRTSEEQLAPLHLQEIKADREWWEALEWDDTLMKQILLPFTKLSEARKSSFYVTEEVGSPGSHQTNVDSIDIGSCLEALRTYMYC
ncbi:unnamed protein product [Amaranthus hypochondriacus]